MIGKSTSMWDAATITWDAAKKICNFKNLLKSVFKRSYRNNIVQILKENFEEMY